MLNDDYGLNTRGWCLLDGLISSYYWPFLSTRNRATGAELFKEFADRCTATRGSPVRVLFVLLQF